MPGYIVWIIPDGWFCKNGNYFRIAAPKEYQPSEVVVTKCKAVAIEQGAKITITQDVLRQSKMLIFLILMYGVSMGEPDSVWEERIRLLKPFQGNMEAIEKTGTPSVKFLHCLPAFHNREYKSRREDIFKKFGSMGWK